MGSWARTDNAALIKLTNTKHNGRFRITSFLQLESRTCLSSAAAKSASPSSHSSFCEEVFSLVATGLWPVRRRTAPWLQRMRWSGRIFWLLASGSAFAERPFFPPSPPNAFGDWPWEVVSSYSSATAPGLHGISRADPLFQARKELLSGLAACCRGLKHKSDGVVAAAHVMSSGNVTLHPLQRRSRYT